MLTWDRFDICEAYYLYAREYHEGQLSKIYEIFGRLHKLKFRPSPLLSYDSLTENGREIFNGLISRNHLSGASTNPDG